MKKLTLFFIFNWLISLPISAEATQGSLPNENNQVINKDELLWRIGGKIHFEEESGPVKFYSVLEDCMLMPIREKQLKTLAHG
jgi:hypothetical protein